MATPLSSQIAFYNPVAIAFSYFNAVFEWLDSGLIRMTFQASALPAVEYSSQAAKWRVKQMLPDIFLIVLITLYLATTIFDVMESIRAQRKQSRSHVYSSNDPDMPVTRSVSTFQRQASACGGESPDRRRSSANLSYTSGPGRALQRKASATRLGSTNLSGPQGSETLQTLTSLQVEQIMGGGFGAREASVGSWAWRIADSEGPRTGGGEGTSRVRGQDEYKASGGWNSLRGMASGSRRQPMVVWSPDSAQPLGKGMEVGHPGGEAEVQQRTNGAAAEDDVTCFGTSGPGPVGEGIDNEAVEVGADEEDGSDDDRLAMIAELVEERRKSKSAAMEGEDDRKKTALRFLEE